MQRTKKNKEPKGAAGVRAPVGTIFAYAGADPGSLKSAGWLLCDGQAVSDSDPKFADLFKAIGYSSGKGDGTFLVPNLQGLFLRGTDRGADRDPDRNTRNSAAPGGNLGDNPGSYQPFATKKPTYNDFNSAQVQHLPTEGAPGQQLSHREQAVWSPKVNVETTGGGDPETRPWNCAVNYIIKVVQTTDNGSPVEIPIGSVMPYAGVELKRDWLLCDGRLMSNRGILNSLFQVINYVYGGEKEIFGIPDFRGLFLRGLSQATSESGNSNTSGSDPLGVIQGFTTARPNNPFLSTVYGLPKDASTVSNSPGQRKAAMPGETLTVSMSSSGGDNESRPINAYVDWYILATRSSTNLVEIGKSERAFQ